jgi:hypothetical protein
MCFQKILLRNGHGRISRDSESGTRRAKCLPMRTLSKNLAAVFAISTLTAQADVPDRRDGQLRGMYKVAASNDPIFPLTEQQEWFLDFGTGTSAGKTSGNVAISLRRNPNVRVRIMAWQYFPERDNLLIGNPFHEGSKQAVARGNWHLRSTRGGVIFERGAYQITLYPAAPGDY